MGDDNLSLRDTSAVCFDAFGTLINYVVRLNPYRRLLVGGPPKQTKRLSLLTRNTSMEAFARELGREAELPTMQRELAQELAALALYPEVGPVLHMLRQAGRKVAVCSNLAGAYGPAVRGLLPTLDAYALSYEVGAAKPDPAIYKAVCTTLRCLPGDVLFIGDSQRCDLQGPRAIGMAAHWLDRARGQTLWDALVEKPHAHR